MIATKAKVNEMGGVMSVRRLSVRITESSSFPWTISVKFIQVDVADWNSFTSLLRRVLVWLEETYGQDGAIGHVVTCVGVSSEEVDFTLVQPDDFIQKTTGPSR